MLFKDSPFTSETADTCKEPLNGSFEWLLEEEDPDDGESGDGRALKRQKTTTQQPIQDDPSTWQVEHIQEDLENLISAVASKGLALPDDLFKFLTTSWIYEAYFDTVDSHYVKLGQHVVQFEDGYLVEFLRCNQDANFWVLYLTKNGDCCVALTNDEFDWEALDAMDKSESKEGTKKGHNITDDEEEGPMRPVTSYFLFYGASVEESLWKLMASYDL